MTIDAYLRRIAYEGPRDPAADTLVRLHRAHMLTVPFENLDIPLGRQITLSLSPIYEKIVRRRRGGFCYELNGLFGWLLERLGYTVVMLSARVYDGARPGPDFDHMVLLVEMDDRLIADVGFGDSFLEPLPLDAPQESAQHGSSYRLSGSDRRKVLERRRADSGWEPQYDFSLTPRRLDEFSPMCHHQQTSPESAFTRKSVCSRATPDGRITLSNDRLITTSGARREERRVASAQEYRALLKAHFGVELEQGARVDRLMTIGTPSTPGEEDA